MKIKVTILVIGFSFLFTPLHSQKRFSPGYVVLNQGDTLYGQVCDRNLRKAIIFNKIRFRSNNSKRSKFSAYDIQSYHVDGTTFESKWFSEQVEFLKFRYNNQYGLGRKVFLRVIAKGRLSLYMKEYVDSDNNYFDGFELFLRDGDPYFQRATQGILGLKKKRLSEYFYDCPELVEKVNYKVFTTPMEVVNYYNSECN